MTKNKKNYRIKRTVEQNIKIIKETEKGACLITDGIKEAWIPPQAGKLIKEHKESTVAKEALEKGNPIGKIKCITFKIDEALNETEKALLIKTGKTRDWIAKVNIIKKDGEFTKNDHITVKEFALTGKKLNYKQGKPEYH